MAVAGPISEAQDEQVQELHTTYLPFPLLSFNHHRSFNNIQTHTVLLSVYSKATRSTVKPSNRNSFLQTSQLILKHPSLPPPTHQTNANLYSCSHTAFDTTTLPRERFFGAYLEIFFLVTMRTFTFWISMAMLHCTVGQIDSSAPGCAVRCWENTKYVSKCLNDNTCLCNEAEYQNVSFPSAIPSLASISQFLRGFVLLC